MRDMKKWVSFELSENKLREVVEVAKKEGFEIEEKKAFEIVKCLYEMFREMYYEEYYEEGEWEVNWKFKKKKNKCKAFLGKEKLVGELFNIFIRVMLDEEKVKFKEAMEESLRIMAEGRDDKIDFFDVEFLMSSRFSFLMRVLGRFIGKYKELLQNGKPEKELSNSSDLLNSVGLLLTVWEDLRSEWFKVFEKNFVVEVG